MRGVRSVCSRPRPSSGHARLPCLAPGLWLWPLEKHPHKMGKRQRHRWRAGRCARSLCPGVASTVAREFMLVIRAALGCHPPPCCWAGDAGGSTLLPAVD